MARVGQIDVPVVVTTELAAPARGRPAENVALGSGGLLGTLSAADGRLWFGLASWAVGVLPHAVSWLYDNGGVRGAARRLIGK